jgi:hypothetical protein
LDIAIAPETPLQDDVRRLVAELNAFLKPQTPIAYQFQLTVEQMADPSLTLFVARDESGEAVGMGGLKDHGEGLGEVKRMFTSPQVRGPAGRHSARHQGPVRHRGRPHPGGSHILDGFKPAYESTVTANLWRDGAVMLGKLNMDEFAMGSSNETSLSTAGGQSVAAPGLDNANAARARAVRRAARPRRWPRWLCAGATATDTGGSIRQPAAFTGTVGIKPTYGRCSRWGIVAFASSLDQAGPIAATSRTRRSC